MYETNTTVVGNLISKVNRRRLPDGTSVADFRVAGNERRYDRANGSWADGDSFYVSVTCWRRLAENVLVSLIVGDPVIVQGRLFSRSYEKDGRRQTVTEMEAAAVGPDLARSTAVVTRTRRAEPRDTEPSGEAPGENGTVGAAALATTAPVSAHGGPEPWPSDLPDVSGHGGAGSSTRGGNGHTEAVEAAVGS